MSVERYNAEHYRDPTAHAALTAVARAEQENYPSVYICSPYSGVYESDVRSNVERACGYALYALSQGKCPVAPHIYFTRFMDDGDPEQRELGLSFALDWLSQCSEIWVFGDRISKGMCLELEAADRREIPVKYFSVKNGIFVCRKNVKENAK